MKKHLLYCLLLTVPVLLHLSSCVEPESPDKPEKEDEEIQQIAIECVLNNFSDTQVLRLYRTNKSGESSINPLHEEDVESAVIRNSSGSYTFHYVSDGVWNVELKQQANTLYQLEIILESGEIISAKTRSPDEWEYPQICHFYKKAYITESCDTVSNFIWWDYDRFSDWLKDHPGANNPPIKSTPWVFVLQPNDDGGMTYSNYVGFPSTSLDLQEFDGFNVIPNRSIWDLHVSLKKISKKSVGTIFLIFLSLIKLDFFSRDV